MPAPGAEMHGFGTDPPGCGIRSRRVVTDSLHPRTGPGSETRFGNALLTLGAARLRRMPRQA